MSEPATASPTLQTTPTPVTLRAAVAGAEDLTKVRNAFEVRDGHAWDEKLVARAACDLDPSRCATWLAMAGDKPVGLSMAYVRQLSGPGGAIVNVAYWANLFVDPAFRDRMLYPRLPLANFEAMRREPTKADFVMASVRLRDVAAAHRRIGFAKVGEMRVLLQPVRPIGLLARKKGWPGFTRLVAASPDALFARFAKRGPRQKVESLALSSGELSDVAELLRADANGKFVQTWTAESLRDRYAVSRDGEVYHLSVTRDPHEKISAAIVCGAATRDPGIKLIVIMDLAFTTPEAGADLLAHVRRQARDTGAHGVLVLDGYGIATHELLRRNGYMISPEIYDLIIYPRAKATGDVASLAAWRFGFGDHDAF